MLKFKKHKLPDNKKYKYYPRYIPGEKQELGIRGMMSKNSYFRENEYGGDRGEQWRAARASYRHRGNREINTRLIAILLILIFLTLWIFDFDLSVFTSTR